MKKTTIFKALFIGILTISLSAPTATGQYYGSPYTTYTCPTGYYLSSQNGIAVCYQYPTTTSYVPDIYQPGYTIQYNNTSYGYIPGCLPGYLYSTLTGRRCDDSNSYNDSYDDWYSSDEASIRNFEVRRGDDTDLTEGERNAEIIEVQFDVEDGRIELDRAIFNFEFTGNNNGEDRPWEIFDEIRLLSDGDEIDTIQTDDEDEWDEEGDDTYSITFDNLDEIIRENDSATLTLEVDISSDIGNYYSSWNIFVPDRGIRAQDSDDHSLYTGDDNEDVSIDIER